ncbi:hypothetical protein ACSVDM_00925 [Nocardia sp. JW2]|uniref:hypothetical protein n=1 Tax=Nocardia sp. JW2 TaxID=3450738 RepID=UPI003F435634
MPEWSLPDLAEAAGNELALRLRMPCDIIDVHRVNGSSAKIYTSLRYGAFLLAYAPIENFFTQLTRYSTRTKGRALPLNLDKIQRELDVQWPAQRFRSNLWEGRARQQSTGPGNRSEWAFLHGKCLKDYLSDMKSLRDLLSHGSDPRGATNTSKTLWKVEDGWSMRLMGVEGFLQFAEDLAEQAMLESGVHPTNVPSWPQPQRTGISRSDLPPLPHRDRLVAWHDAGPGE